LDFKQYNYNMILTRSKNKSYRERVKKNGKTLMKFLKDNGLILIEPFNESGELKEDLLVMQSNLTEEGNLLFKDAVVKWWKFLDKEGNPDNISILEKGLKKIREEK
jgi:hypothetical protein